MNRRKESVLNVFALFDQAWSDNQLPDFHAYKISLLKA